MSFWKDISKREKGGSKGCNPLRKKGIMGN